MVIITGVKWLALWLCLFYIELTVSIVIVYTLSLKHFRLNLRVRVLPYVQFLGLRIPRSVLLIYSFRVGIVCLSPP